MGRTEHTSLGRGELGGQDTELLENDVRDRAGQWPPGEIIATSTQCKCYGRGGISESQAMNN